MVTFKFVRQREPNSRWNQSRLHEFQVNFTTCIWLNRWCSFSFPFFTRYHKKQENVLTAAIYWQFDKEWDTTYEVSVTRKHKSTQEQTSSCSVCFDQIETDFQKESVSVTAKMELTRTDTVVCTAEKYMCHSCRWTGSIHCRECDRHLIAQVIVGSKEMDLQPRCMFHIRLWQFEGKAWRGCHCWMARERSFSCRICVRTGWTTSVLHVCSGVRGTLQWWLVFAVYHCTKNVFTKVPSCEMDT